MKLLQNEEKISSTKTELIHFKFALPFAKLDLVGSGQVSNDLIFSGGIPVISSWQLFYFYLTLEK